MQVINNRPTYGHAAQTGSGIASAPIGAGHTTISGKAGDVTYVELSAVNPRYNLNFGVYAQAVNGGGIVIAATLATPDLAKDPAQAASAIWVADSTVATGTLVLLKYIATVYKITFTAAGTLFLMGV